MSFLMNYEGLSGLTGDNVHYNFKLQQNLTDGAAAVAFQGLKCWPLLLAPPSGKSV